jgi:hypothetical protein
MIGMEKGIFFIAGGSAIFSTLLLEAPLFIVKLALS